MIIWTKLGFLVAIIAFASLVATELSVEAATQNENFYQDNGWPKMLAFLVAGATVWPLGR